MRRVLGCAALFAAAACGSGTDISGTYKGHSVDVASATLALVDAGAGGSYAVALISNGPDICRSYSIGIANGQTVLLVSLAIVTPSGTLVPPTVAGRYDVVGHATAGSKIAAAWFGVIGQYTVGDHAPAVGGNVQLTHVELGGYGLVRIEGSFSFQFASGDKLQGQLGVDLCNPD